VRTGADGRAEILLNPGSYLRLGAASEFELTDPSLDSLRLKLSRGSALVEAAGYADADAAIALDTPRASVSLVRSGVYRFNVAESGATEVFVRKGRALVGAGRTLLKGGMSARFGASGVAEVAKFDKKESDALDAWGKSRAEELARAQRKLRARQVNASFVRNRAWDSLNASDGLFGVWYWSAGGSCYTFLPFYYWVSPYGYSYDLGVPAFAYLCGSCRRLNRPWQPSFANPAQGGGVVTTMPPTFTKPAKSFEPAPDNGGKMSPGKVGVNPPPAGDGGSPAVRDGGATKGVPPPDQQN
jgi:hypothetical protein